MHARSPLGQRDLAGSATADRLVVHARTTAYHPVANGIVERLHRQLKAALMAHAVRQHWVDNLPIVHPVIFQAPG